MAVQKAWAMMLLICILCNSSSWSFDLCVGVMNDTGVCIPVKDCKYYYKIIKNGFSQYYKWIADNKCSLPQDQFYICCPLNKMESVVNFAIPLAQNVTDDDVISEFITPPTTRPPTTRPPTTRPPTTRPPTTRLPTTSIYSNPFFFYDNPFLNTQVDESTQYLGTMQPESIIFPPGKDVQTFSREDGNRKEGVNVKPEIFNKNPFKNLRSPTPARTTPITTEIDTTKSFNERTKCGTMSTKDSHIESVAKLKEHPWTALLEYKSAKKDATEFRCGGSLISDRFVVTSASCATADNRDGWKIFSVRLGESDLRTNPDCVDFLDKRMCADTVQNIKVDKIIIHPDFEIYSTYHDIALLYLATQVQFSEYVQPICILTDDSQNIEEQQMIAVGWKMPIQDDINSSKQITEVNTLSNKSCNLFLESSPFESTNGVVCVVRELPNKLNQMEDSLILEIRINSERTYYLAGILALDDGNFEPTDPAVFVKISSYYNWIAKYIYHSN